MSHQLFCLTYCFTLVVVLKNCETEFSYILAELVNKSLKKSCFQIFVRFHWWSPYLRMLGKSLQLNSITLLVFFMWLVKSLKNLKTIALLITAKQQNCLFS